MKAKTTILDLLLKVQNKETWVEDINDIICLYSIAVISTFGETEYERTSTHLLILKDLGNAFYESIPN